MNYQLWSAERSKVRTDFTYSISKTWLTRSANRKLRSLDSESMIGQTSRQHKKMRKSSGRRRELQSSGISSERRSDPLDTELNKRLAAAMSTAIRHARRPDCPRPGKWSNRRTERTETLPRSPSVSAMHSLHLSAGFRPISPHLK